MKATSKKEFDCVKSVHKERDRIASAFIERVKSEHRPLVLTQHGKSSAALIDVEDYLKLLDKVQIQEISSARKELNEGKGIDKDEFFTQLRSQFSNSSELFGRPPQETKSKISRSISPKIINYQKLSVKRHGYLSKEERSDCTVSNPYCG